MHIFARSVFGTSHSPGGTCSLKHLVQIGSSCHLPRSNARGWCQPESLGPSRQTKRTEPETACKGRERPQEWKWHAARSAAGACWSLLLHYEDVTHLQVLEFLFNLLHAPNSQTQAQTEQEHETVRPLCVCLFQSFKRTAS